MYLVKTHDFICQTVEHTGDGASKFSRQTDKRKRAAIAVVLAPLFIVSNTFAPHIFKVAVSLIAVIQSCKHNGNAEEHKELVLDIFFQHRLFYFVKLYGFEAALSHQNVMGISFL